MELEEYNGEEVIIEKEVKTVGLNEYIYDTDGNRILQTKSIHDCIVVLIKSNDKVGMCHINISNNESYEKGLNVVRDMINNVEGDINTSIFYGSKTPMEKCKELASYLEAHIYPVYMDAMGEGGIAYDTECDKIYGVDLENRFYEYKLGAINREKDPIQECFNGGHKL